ncbi:MAG: tetratricopeptide repeat protein, partial [Candidatus Rokuibacteriota bacterium]
TSEPAIAALGDASDVEARRGGARALGEIGRMEDVPHLIRALRDPDPVVRALAENSMWQVWSRSGDDDIDRLFALGLEQMSQRQIEAAAQTFTRIVERRPDFAEGWNKRATVYFLQGELEKSLADCDEVIRRNPHHYGALSGYGMIYLQLDQPARALQYLERALAVNPNLPQVEETIEALRRLLFQERKDTI